MSTRTPRLPPEVRRRQIMDATLRVATTVGFAELTIDAIAAEAGISRPVVYDLFGDLRGVLTAMITEASARATAAIDEALPDVDGGAPPAALLEEAYRTMLGAIRDDPAMWRLILLPPRGAPPEIRDEIARRRAQTLARVIPRVRWGLDELQITGVRDDVVARVLLATAEEMGRLVLEHPRRFAPERIARTLHELVGIIPEAGDG